MGHRAGVPGARRQGAGQCNLLIRPEDINEAVASPRPAAHQNKRGELRLGNFLLWQSAYTELYYFTSKMWPDFGEDECL